MPDNQYGFNINVFKAELSSKKVLRPNLFLVEFSIPNSLLNLPAYQENFRTAQTLSYWCEATNLPGLNIRTYEGQRYGYGSIEQRPLLPAYSEISFGLIFDSNCSNYKIFFDWINSMVNTNASQGFFSPSNQTNSGLLSANKVIDMSAFEIAYKQDYAVDTSILVFDQEGFMKKKITLRESFPKIIGDISLNWADNNSYMRLPIVMAYTDWYNGEIPQDNRQELPPADYYNLF